MNRHCDDLSINLYFRILVTVFADLVIGAPSVIVVLLVTMVTQIVGLVHATLQVVGTSNHVTSSVYAR